MAAMLAPYHIFCNLPQLGALKRLLAKASQLGRLLKKMRAQAS